MLRLSHTITFALVSACILLSACGPKQELAYARSDLSMDHADVLHVLKPVDGRIRKSTKDKYSEQADRLMKRLVRRLESRGYTVVVDSGTSSSLSADKVAFATADEARAFGPSGAQYVVIPVIEDLVTAHVAVYMFEKQTGRLLWEGSAYSPKRDIRGPTSKVVSLFPKR